MKILMLYNEFRSLQGGEDKVVDNMVVLFRRHNIDCRLERRSSKDLNLVQKSRAFFSGIYSFESARFVRDLIIEEKPDVMHVHNLLPLFSPSVLIASRSAGVPVVMTVHNFALTCPHWFHYRDGKVCELCARGNVLWCVAHNCQENVFESVGYAIRSGLERQMGFFRKNVSMFVALTDFAKQRLITSGIDGDKIDVIPNMIKIPEQEADIDKSTYVAFAGRMSSEKGVKTLIEAARLLPEVPFRLAGAGPLLGELMVTAPPNVKFSGLLGSVEMNLFYRNARMLVVPSVWFEMCPTTILEGMAAGIPVVTSDLGGLPELVEDQVRGLVFKTGDPASLADRIRLLWGNPRLCKSLGASGRDWTIRNCNESAHFNRLMAVYRQVIGDCE